MDDDGNKTLGFDEFNKGVRDTGLRLTDEQTRILFRRFDRDGNGSIDMTEFLIAVRVRTDFFVEWKEEEEGGVEEIPEIEEKF